MLWRFGRGTGKVKASLLKIVDIAGLLLGRLSGLWSCGALDYLMYRFGRHVATGRMGGRIGSGAHFLLAPGIQLIHPENIHLDAGVSILRGCVLETIPRSREQQPKMKIGKGTSIGEYSHITCAGNITIGNNVLTGRFVLISDNSHGEITREQMLLPPLARPVVSGGDITIGDRVWLGDRVVVLGGVHIGEGAVIGANAVVTHDIPPFSVAVGVPAKVIKQL